MEGLMVLKYCQWVSPEINLKDYFDEYKQLLREANADREHYLKVDPNNAIKDFFYSPEVDVDASRRNSPVNNFKVTVSSTNGKISSEVQSNVLDKKGNYPVGSASAILDVANCINENIDSPGTENDLFHFDELEKSVDLFTVDGELPPRDVPQVTNVGSLGRCTNWYTGSYMDGIIPEKAPENLSTLAAQARELYKRETKKDYIRYRNRQLKYASTVRMVMKNDNVPEDIPAANNLPDSCLNDIICNVRIQRPYHKKTLQRKGINEYPKYSEEFLILGSQSLTELRDCLVCVNDHYCHQEMSENPDLNLVQNFATLEDSYPSGFFYINGVFYIDKRNPTSSDISEKISAWAKLVPNYKDVIVRDMITCKFIDLKINLGYPYLYQHLGNCEHLVTVTDIRLHHRGEIQDPNKYPLLRGNPVKMSFKCFGCNLYRVSWVVKDSCILSTPFAHFCDGCLKMKFYDNNGKKVGDFKLYPFMDEIAAKKRKLEKTKHKKVNFKQIIIDGWKADGSSKFTFIK